MEKPTRSLKIRKKAPENEKDVQVALIKAVLDKELAPMREQILILKQNSHSAGVMLRDIFGCALMADSLSASTKNKLEEYFNHMNASSANLENYLEIAGEELPQQVDLDVFRSLEAVDILQEIRDAGEVDEDTEADAMMENVSEEEDEWGL